MKCTIAPLPVNRKFAPGGIIPWIKLLPFLLRQRWELTAGSDEKKTQRSPAGDRTRVFRYRSDAPELRSHGRNCVRIFSSFTKLSVLFSLRGGQNVWAYKHTETRVAGWGSVVQWLVQRFQSERLPVQSWWSATFTPSAHVRRQSLPVWPPMLNKKPLPLPTKTGWICSNQKFVPVGAIPSNQTPSLFSPAKLKTDSWIRPKKKKKKKHIAAPTVIKPGSSGCWSDALTTELRSCDRNCVWFFLSFTELLVLFSLRSGQDVRAYKHTETNENSMNWIKSVQIESLLLSGPFHQIKLLPVFSSKVKNWQLEGPKKKKTIAAPRAIKPGSFDCWSDALTTELRSYNRNCVRVFRLSPTCQFFFHNVRWPRFSSLQTRDEKFARNSCHGPVAQWSVRLTGNRKTLVWSPSSFYPYHFTEK